MRKKTKIFVFTATGNCLKIAEKLSENIPDSEIIRLTADTPYYDASGDDIVGIVYPVYCGNAPEIARRFVSNMGLSDSTYFFGVATHGGHVVIGSIQIADILNKRGHARYGLFDIEMVHNGAFIAPVPEADEIRRITDEAYRRAELTAARINAGELNTIPDAAETIEKISENPMAKMVVFSFDPNRMGKDYYLSGECIRCGNCERVCPMANVTLTDSGPVWGDKCELCMACLQWCPKEAIQFVQKDMEVHSSEGKKRYRNPDVSITDIFVR